MITGWQDYPTPIDKRPADGTEHRWEHLMIRAGRLSAAAELIEAKNAAQRPQDKELTTMSHETRLQALEEGVKRLEDKMQMIMEMLSSHLQSPASVPVQQTASADQSSDT